MSLAAVDSSHRLAGVQLPELIVIEAQRLDEMGGDVLIDRSPVATSDGNLLHSRRPLEHFSRPVER